MAKTRLERLEKAYHAELRKENLKKEEEKRVEQEREKARLDSMPSYEATLHIVYTYTTSRVEVVDDGYSGRCAPHPETFYDHHTGSKKEIYEFKAENEAEAHKKVELEIAKRKVGNGIQSVTMKRLIEVKKVISE